MTKPPQPPVSPTRPARQDWAAALREWRGARSQAEVAALFGVSERSWYRWEAGEMPGPVPRRLIWGDGAETQASRLEAVLLRIEAKLDAIMERLTA